MRKDRCQTRAIGGGCQPSPNSTNPDCVVMASSAATSLKGGAVRAIFYQKASQCSACNRVAVQGVVKRCYRPNGRSFRSFLLFDVLFEHRQWSAAHGQDAVTAAPEYGFTPIIPFQVIGKFFAQQATGNCFKIIHQCGWQHLGRQRQKQMRVIRLAVEFQHLTFPFRRRITADGLQPVQHGSSHALAAIFRDQNQMIVQIINTMMQGT